GAGNDTVSYYFAASGVTARLDRPELNTGEAAGDTYSGIENLYGSQFDDVLAGDGGRNTLTGWGGADDFLFATPLHAGNVDTITDFEPGVDRILLNHIVFTALAQGALSPAAFALGAGATTASHHILYDPASGLLAYDSDGTGGTSPVPFAQLGAGLSISSNDFFVV
ncbi:MAG TPA: hypothetical protein VIL20_13485, partial [Sandaracinaceae bacterium]